MSHSCMIWICWKLFNDWNLQRTNTSRLVLIIAIPDSNIQLFCEHFNGTIPVTLYLSSGRRKWRFGEFKLKNCSPSPLPSHKSSFRQRSPLVSLLKPYFRIILRWRCFWKDFAGKRSAGTRESEQKSSSFSRHALARPPRFSHFAKRKWKRLPHRQAGVVCGLISVALFSIQVQPYPLFY